MLKDYEKILDRVTEKYRNGIDKAVALGHIPYIGEGKNWLPSPFDGESWWTNGFWTGMMWQLYHRSGDEAFLREARRTGEVLAQEFRSFNKLNHDVGFMYLLSAGADQLLTGREDAKRDLLHAAELLMGRFNPVGFIRAWNEPERVGYAIVDCMMNLSLLFTASALTGDPRFRKVAVIHADTTKTHFVREDGSLRHIVEFDPETGNEVSVPQGQGFSPESSWSRGQAWGLYGFTLAYINTGKTEYLETAEKIAAYFDKHIRKDGLTDCDFCQPREPERIDNLAGAIAACGYLELAEVTGNQRYRETALRLLDGLIDLCCDLSDNTVGLLTRCTARYHGDQAGENVNMVYGDYFFTEALCKLCGTDPRFWTNGKRQPPDTEGKA